MFLSWKFTYGWVAITMQDELASWSKGFHCLRLAILEHPSLKRFGASNSASIRSTNHVNDWRWTKINKANPPKTIVEYIIVYHIHDTKGDQTQLERPGYQQPGLFHLHVCNPLGGPQDVKLTCCGPHQKKEKIQHSYTISEIVYLQTCFSMLLQYHAGMSQNV